MSDTNVAKTDAKSTEAERTETGVMLPPVDVIEDAMGITLYADLPGVSGPAVQAHHALMNADARGSVAAMAARWQSWRGDDSSTSH